MSDVTWRRGDPTLSAYGQEIKISNAVRLNRDGSVIYTFPGRIPYKPQPFPASPPGGWRIIGVEAQPRGSHLWPFAVLTDAWQMVEEWTLTPEGKYDHPTGRMVRDGHYWIHFSDLDFTWGCLRALCESELRWFAGETLEVLAQIRAITHAPPWITFDVLEA